ncbi:hypothetical protein ANO14919_049150 [Xylariales sp. No.14919]|nr:hypothetical protein ANO14919_049150 [Xylariales sp. No.14919]
MGGWTALYILSAACFFQTAQLNYRLPFSLIYLRRDLACLFSEFTVSPGQNGRRAHIQVKYVLSRYRNVVSSEELGHNQADDSAI